MAEHPVVCQERLKPTTCANKDFLFQRHVLPYLGKRKADSVDAAQIRKWQNTLLSAKKDDTEQTYALTYLKTVHNQVSAMFNFGVKYYGIKSNPCRKAGALTYLKTVHNQVSAMFNFGVKYYGIKSNPCRKAGAMGKKNADAMQFWTVEKFHTFLSAVSNKPQSVVMFSLLFWTGIRSGELLALTPADFDFEHCTVSISKNYARQHGKDLILEPKTPKSHRVIPIPSTLAALVRQYLTTLYGISDENRIFAGNTKHLLLHEMKRGCAASGIKRIRIHDLRQQYLTTLYGISDENRIFAGNTKHLLLHEMKRGCAASGIKRIRIHDLRHPYGKHTTKKYDCEKQKSQATKKELIA